MTRNYWSCSAFADWLRGKPKPSAGTAQEWKAWKKTAKIKKMRYWLAEDGLDYLQNFIHSPLDLIKNIRCYARNRLISKTHALTSNLKRGQWYDFDTRVLHALFDELVHFVEVEQVWNPSETGLAHLERAASFKNNEDWVDKNDSSFGKPTHQALAAQETIVLYKWWKEARPKRPDPMDASGWSGYCDARRQTATSQEDPFWIDKAGGEDAQKLVELCHQMEQEQEEEDTEMLIRLIKIRGSLWT